MAAAPSWMLRTFEFQAAGDAKLHASSTRAFQLKSVTVDCIVNNNEVPSSPSHSQP
jgi:hypothetical protein